MPQALGSHRWRSGSAHAGAGEPRRSQARGSRRGAPEAAQDDSIDRVISASGVSISADIGARVRRQGTGRPHLPLGIGPGPGHADPADAFLTALETWRRDGVPSNPGAWPTTVARKRALDRIRRAARRAGVLSELERSVAEGSLESAVMIGSETRLVDDRLRLIFTCCHPTRAVAVAEAGGAAAGLAIVDGIVAGGSLDGYHLLHATCCTRPAPTCCDGWTGPTRHSARTRRRRNWRRRRSSARSSWPGPAICGGRRATEAGREELRRAESNCGGRTPAARPCQGRYPPRRCRKGLTSDRERGCQRRAAEPGPGRATVACRAGIPRRRVLRAAPWRGGLGAGPPARRSGAAGTSFGRSNLRRQCCRGYRRAQRAGRRPGPLRRFRAPPPKTWAEVGARRSAPRPRRSQSPRQVPTRRAASTHG